MAKLHQSLFLPAAFAFAQRLLAAAAIAARPAADILRFFVPFAATGVTFPFCAPQRRATPARMFASPRALSLRFLTPSRFDCREVPSGSDAKPLSSEPSSLWRDWILS